MGRVRRWTRQAPQETACQSVSVPGRDAAHPEVSLQGAQSHLEALFETYALRKRIWRDNGLPFASSALARLYQLSVWLIKLGICPELIEPGEPQENGVHERMHRTLKQETTIPLSGT